MAARAFLWYTRKHEGHRYACRHEKHAREKHARVCRFCVGGTGHPFGDCRTGRSSCASCRRRGAGRLWRLAGAAKARASLPAVPEAERLDGALLRRRPLHEARAGGAYLLLRPRCGQGRGAPGGHGDVHADAGRRRGGGVVRRPQCGAPFGACRRGRGFPSAAVRGGRLRNGRGHGRLHGGGGVRRCLQQGRAAPRGEDGEGGRVRAARLRRARARAGAEGA